MIVWGVIVDPSPSNTGGRYNPASNSWLATTLVKDPTTLARHRAVWTGTEMIVFGGFGSSVPTGLQRYAPPYPRTLYMFQRQ